MSIARSLARPLARSLANSLVANDERVPFGLTETNTGTITIDGVTGNITVTITSPAAYAGTYTTDVDSNTLNTTNLNSGPMCLVAPVIVDDGSPASGETLTIVDGLWLYNTAHPEPVITYQWRSDVGGNAVFSDISGATSSSYTLTADEGGDDVLIRETATQSGTGARSADSAAVSVAATAATAAYNNTQTMSGSGTSWTATVTSSGPQTLLLFVSDNTTAYASAVSASTYGAADEIKNAANGPSSVLVASAIFNGALSAETVTLTTDTTPGTTPSVIVIDLANLGSTTAEDSEIGTMPATTTLTMSTLLNPSTANGLLLFLGFGRNSVSGSSVDEGSIFQYDGTTLIAGGYPVLAKIEGQHTGGDGAWQFTDTSSPFGRYLALTLD